MLDFVVRGNVEEIIGVDRFDVVVECTDNSMDKAAICAHCAKHTIEIVTVGGVVGEKMITIFPHSTFMLCTQTKS